MKKLVTILVTIAMMLSLVGCTAKPADKKPVTTPVGTTPVGTPVVPAAGEFKDTVVLAEGAAAQEVKLTVDAQNVPTLTVGTATLAFTKTCKAAFDSCKFEVRLIEGGALIFAMPNQEARFFANVAMYDGTTLTEVVFPYDLDTIAENATTLFTGEWTADDKFEVKSVLGGDLVKAVVDEAAFKTLTGKKLSDYTKTNTFAIGENSMVEINDKTAAVTIKVALTYEADYTFATATMTFNFDVATKAYTFGTVAYEFAPVADCGVTAPANS